MSVATHVFQADGKYCLQVQVPADLTAKLGMREIRRPLATTVPGVARNLTDERRRPGQGPSVEIRRNHA